MSNTMINWRFWVWHLQVLQFSDWRWSDRGRIVRWSRNDYWSRGGRGREVREGGDRWTPVAFYEGRRYLIVLVALIALLVWAVL